MNQATLPKFSSSHNRTFQNELRKRVDMYFKDNNISKNGNLNMYLKTTFMFLLYFIPFFLILFGITESRLSWLFLSLLMGLGMAGIGLCVMHDANHGSYSRNVTINKFIGNLSMTVLGGYALNWRLQHNVLHHTYTNVHEHDEDIAPPGFMRFEPHAERKGIHKFQFIYAWFFYGLMTLMWATTKDFRQLARYNKMGLLESHKTTYGKEIGYLVLGKIVYMLMMLLPYFFVKSMTFGEWLVGFLFIHYLAGVVLAMIFQSAHVVKETEFLKKDEDGQIHQNWLEHQLRTTMNFATGDPVFSWLVGGLNFQVEHHLFPNICHIHYPKISKIVEATAREFDVPYNVQKTFVGAVWSHEVMLWRLGRV